MSEHHLNKRVTKLEEKVGHLENVYTPRQEVETGVGPQNTTEKKPDPAPRQSTPIHDVPSAPKDPRRAKYPWYKTLQGWYYLLGIIGIPFAIGYAVVTYFQWHDLRHNFEVDQRAWMKAELGLPATINEKMTIDVVPVTYRNIGKSPALRSFVNCALKLFRNNEEPYIIFEGRKHTFTDIPFLFPGDRNDSVANLVFADDSMRALSIPEIQSLIAGESYLAVFAEITYVDQFGAHWTHSCAWKAYSTGPAQFRADACVAWNAARDGSPPKESMPLLKR